MTRRLDLSPVLSAAGGVILAVSLFLHWYEPGLNAWKVFEVLDLVLAALAIAAVWAALEHLVWDADLRSGVLLATGAAAFVVVVSQLLNHPPAAQGSSVQSGAWVALGGSALMAVGGILSATRVSLSVSFSPRPERRATAPSSEAAAAEPEVQEELYPEHERGEPIGADDPEPWTAAPEDETMPIDTEREEPS